MREAWQAMGPLVGDPAGAGFVVQRNAAPGVPVAVRAVEDPADPAATWRFGCHGRAGIRVSGGGRARGPRRELIEADLRGGNDRAAPHPPPPPCASPPMRRTGGVRVCAVCVGRREPWGEAHTRHTRIYSCRRNPTSALISRAAAERAYAHAERRRIAGRTCAAALNASTGAYFHRRVSLRAAARWWRRARPSRCPLPARTRSCGTTAGRRRLMPCSPAASQ